jgi:anti-sigma factor RsiW
LHAKVRITGIVYIEETEMHPSEETIERYTMGRLTEPELECFEEHLLHCADCQDRVAEADRFVPVIREALTAVAAENRALDAGSGAGRGPGADCRRRTIAPLERFRASSLANR